MTWLISLLDGIIIIQGAWSRERGSGSLSIPWPETVAQESFAQGSRCAVGGIGSCQPAFLVAHQDPPRP